jgi:DnaJ-class molecular chaperone
METITDNYKEHKFHTKYNLDEHCSDCFKEARKCAECKGFGSFSTLDYVYAGEPHQAYIGDDEKCENCNGSGIEPDEDIIKERLANV